MSSSWLEGLFLTCSSPVPHLFTACWGCSCRAHGCGYPGNGRGGNWSLSSLASMVHDVRLVSKLEGERDDRFHEPGAETAGLHGANPAEAGSGGRQRDPR